MSASKKKLSLQEFYQDDYLTALGEGSWADDDFDPSSISVPLMGQRPHHDNFANHQPRFGNMPPRGGPTQGHFGSRPAPGPSGPPFIVKLSNVPAYFGNEHIDELFESRFMKFVKSKLLWEVDHEALRLSPNPADALNKRKKVAFVELASSADFDKVLRWTDVYIENGLGKLRIDPANFDDFRIHMEINQSAPEADDPSLSLAKRRSSNTARSPVQRMTLLHRPPPAPHAIPNSSIYPAPLQEYQNAAYSQQRPIRDHPLPPLHPPSPAPPPKKSNPFGNARPVDTLSKQMEIEKSLQSLEINSTTFRTLGHQHESKPVEQKKSESTQKQPPPAEKKPSPPPPKKQSPTPPGSNFTPQLKPATQPLVSAWGTPANGSSFSQVASPPKHPLGLHMEDGPQSFSKKKASPPDDTTKTVVLKRKHAEQKKSRISSPEVKEDPKQTEKTTVGKKELLKNVESLDARLEDEPAKESSKEGTSALEAKTERPKRERPAREKPKQKDATLVEQPKELANEESKDIDATNLTFEERQTLKKEKRKLKERARREKLKAEKESAKSGSNSIDGTPAVKAPATEDPTPKPTSQPRPKSMKKENSKESIQEDVRSQSKPRPPKSEKPAKKAGPKESTDAEPRTADAYVENSETPRPKSKRGRGGRGGSRASTRDSSISPDKPAERTYGRPPASARSMATGVNAIDISGSKGEDGAFPARGRGGSRGRGGRGRGAKVFHNLTQTYNNKSESKPE